MAFIQNFLQPIISGYANVMAFGADSNGVQDSTSAIQSAINSQPASGAVLFPAGTYKISSPLTISSGTIHLIGSGRNATFLETSSTTTDVIQFNGSTFDSSVRSMTIAGTGNTTAVSGAGISTANGVGAILVFDVRIEGTFYGLFVNNGTNSISGVVKCLQVDISSVGNDGIYVNGISQITLTDITMFQPGGHSGGAGYHFQSGGGFYLTNCQAGGFFNGFLVNPPNGSNVFDIFMNIFEADSCASSGVVFDTTAGGTIYGVLASDVRSGFSAAGEGILFTGSNTANVSLNNFSCQRNFTNGLTITDLNNGMISGGQAIGNNAAGTSFVGIAVAGGNGLIITNCNVGLDPSGGGTQAIGIDILASFANSINVINNNVIGNTTNINNSSSSGGVTIANNIT